MAQSSSFRIGVLVAVTITGATMLWWADGPTKSATRARSSAREKRQNDKAVSEVSGGATRHRWGGRRSSTSPDKVGDSNSQDFETVPHHASRAGPEGRDTTQYWASLSAQERLDLLEKELDTALVELQTGDASARGRAINALTALRTELYRTPEGQARHAELERQLELLTKD